MGAVPPVDVQQDPESVWAVRAPAYFPRLSYLALIQQADRFMLADTYQYSRQSFHNRARIRTPQGWQWISIPLKGRQHGRPIRDVEIDGRRAWLSSHRRALMYNYRSTPFYAHYEAQFREIFAETWTTLGELTCSTVRLLCRLYEIDTPLVTASTLPGRPARLPAVLASLAPERVLVPVASEAHDVPYLAHPLRLRFEEPAYRQNFEGYVPDLSALDLLFNAGPDASRLLRAGAVVEPVRAIRPGGSARGGCPASGPGEYGPLNSRRRG